MTSPHKPTAALWSTVALVAVLVGYPLSLGPLNWLDLRQDPDARGFAMRFVCTGYLKKLSSRKCRNQFRAHTWNGGRADSSAVSGTLPLFVARRAGQSPGNRKDPTTRCIDSLGAK